MSTSYGYFCVTHQSRSSPFHFRSDWQPGAFWEKWPAIAALTGEGSKLMAFVVTAIGIQDQVELEDWLGDHGFCQDVRAVSEYGDEIGAMPARDALDEVTIKRVLAAIRPLFLGPWPFKGMYFSILESSLGDRDALSRVYAEIERLLREEGT